MKKILLTILAAIALSPLTASAIPVTVPSATAPGDILYGLSSGQYTILPIGANGKCLGVSASLPAYITCASGSGTWSTTTSTVAGQLVNYPNNDTDVVTIGANSTTTAEFFFNPNTNRFIVASGSVGIGTALPTDILHIVGGDFRIAKSNSVADSITNNINFVNTNVTLNPLAAISVRTGATTANSNLIFQTANSGTPAEVVRITGAGNLAIGTTTAPSSLTINSSAAGSAAVAQFGRSGAGLGRTYDIGINNILTGSTVDAIHSITAPGVSGGHVFNVSNAGVSTYAVGISKDGNLAVATTAPAARIHVQGTDGGTYPFAISGNSKGMRTVLSSTGIALQGVDTTLVASYQPISLDGSVVTIKSGGTTEAIKVDSNQNIGLGSTTPGTSLAIGNTGANTINISTTATSTFGSGINLRSGCFAVGGVCITGGGGGGSSGPVTTTLEADCEPQTDSTDFAPGGAYWQPIYGFTMTNATSSRLLCNVAIPANLATTPNISILPQITATGTPSTGIAVVDVTATTTRLGQNWYTTRFTDVHTASTTAAKRFQLTTGTSLPLNSTTTITLAGLVTVTAGDILKFEITRYGADANDTVDNDIFIPKVLVQLDTN